MGPPAPSRRRRAAPLALALLAPYLLAGCAAAQTVGTGAARAAPAPAARPLTVYLHTAHPIARDEIAIVPLGPPGVTATDWVTTGQGSIQTQAQAQPAHGRHDPPACLPIRTEVGRSPAEPAATVSVAPPGGSRIGLMYRGKVYPLEVDPRGAPVVDVYLAPDRRNAAAMGDASQPGPARVEQWATITWGPGDRALDVLVDGVVQGRTTITRSVRPGRRTFEWRSGSRQICQQTLGVLPNMQATLVCGSDGLVRQTP